MDLNEQFNRFKKIYLIKKIFIIFPILLSVLSSYLSIEKTNTNVFSFEVIPFLFIVPISVFIPSYIFTNKIVKYFFKSNFKDLYKKQLTHILIEKSQYDIKNITEEEQIEIERQFKNLISIPETDTYHFEDFLKINIDNINYIYFEVKTIRYNNSNYANNGTYDKTIKRYSVVVILNKNNSKNSFHILSKYSNFITTDNLKYEDRIDQVSNTFVDFFKKHIWNSFLKSFFIFMYAPIINKIKKLPQNQELISKTIKLYTIHTIIIISAFSIIYSILISISDTFKNIINVILILSISGPVIFILGYSFLTKNKGKTPYRNINLDNTDFNKYFDIHTKNAIESYSFLKPINLEKILLLKDKKNLSIETADKNIFIVMEGKKNLFELSGGYKNLDSLINKHLKELNEVFKYIKDFNFE